MEYMLMIIDNEETVAAASPAEIGAILDRHHALSEELHAAGAWIASYRLRPGREAATVRRKRGKVAIVDGPFAETKELLGGLYIVAAASMEEAVGWAQKIPTLEGSVVEVRPVWGTTRSREWREA